MSGVAFIMAALLCCPASATIPPASALIVVDMQNDFLYRHGALYVRESENIIERINQLTAHPGWDIVIFTTDYHPDNHISFIENNPFHRGHEWHPGMAPVPLSYDGYFRICEAAYRWGDLHYGDSVNGDCHSCHGCPYQMRLSLEQELWPKHCVQGTDGALIDTARVHVPETARIVRKGITTVIDSYGAFTNNVGAQLTNREEKRAIAENNMEEMLHDRNIRNVYVTGVAMDYCVKNTAIQARHLDFTTFLVEDATKAADPDQVEATHHELDIAGVQFTTTSQLLGRRLSNLTMV